MGREAVAHRGMAYARGMAKVRARKDATPKRPRRGRPQIITDPVGLGVDLERPQHEALKAWARERGISVSEAIRRLVAKAVGR